MSSTTKPIPYSELAALADKLLEQSDEDVEELARGLDALDAGLRNELLVSDLLNAYQVFFYFFRMVPDDLTRERLELEPASALVHGLKIDEIELMDIIFVVKNNRPVMIVSDGDQIVTTYSSKTAYADALAYASSTL